MKLFQVAAAIVVEDDRDDQTVVDDIARIVDEALTTAGYTPSVCQACGGARLTKPDPSLTEVSHMADHHAMLASCWRWQKLQNIAAIFAAAGTVTGLALVDWGWWSLLGFAFVTLATNGSVKTTMKRHG